jgi:threonine dehydratase
VDQTPAEIYLKLENLQPVCSFKIRGASNAISLATKEQLAKGVFTASAGNMALFKTLRSCSPRPPSLAAR